MSNKAYRITYEFRFKDGAKNIFNVELDPKTVIIIRPDNASEPEWTKLENHKCHCCTLDEKEHAYCPVALNIAELVEKFKDAFSFDNCIVRCTTNERTYLKKTSIQEGLFSIFGIIMATSDCPIMSFFKPMARFHLPFSTIQETVFRSTSIYLLRQYFEHKNGRTPDLDLEKLDEHYEKVQQVNNGILGRTSNVANKDADNNAIIILNALAQMLSVEIDDNLNSLEYLFS